MNIKITLNTHCFTIVQLLCVLYCESVVDCFSLGMSDSYGNDCDSYCQEGHDDEGKPRLQETTNSNKREREEEKQEMNFNENIFTPHTHAHKVISLLFNIIHRKLADLEKCTCRCHMASVACYQTDRNIEEKKSNDSSWFYLLLNKD